MVAERTRRTKIRRSTGEIVFDSANAVILVLVCCTTLYPFLRILAVSLSAPYALTAFPLAVTPRGFTLDSFISILHYKPIINGFRNSVVITVVGTLADVAMTTMLAYPLSKKRLPHRTFFTMLCVFTMFFDPGLIPTYLNVRSLGLIDRYLALVVPRLIRTYNMLICRNFFMSISPEIEESASVEGANDVAILFRLILPISKPIIMTLVLWYAVARWNSYFDCMIYMTTPDKYVVSVVLRDIINWGATDKMPGDRTGTFNVELVRASTIVVTMVPIILVYPFVQRHFVAGIMVGSLKG
jgi:putative aldouronate transport system permease protein